MIRQLQHIHPIVFILIATIFEVSGDALVRTAIYKHAGLIRIGFMGIGAALLFMYGFSLNLAPVEFGQVVGLYIATLFIVWQVITFIAFRSIPTVPIIIGGAMVIAGGLIINFWK